MVHKNPLNGEDGCLPADSLIPSGFAWNGCTLLEVFDDAFELRGGGRTRHRVSLQLDGPMSLDFPENGEKRAKSVRPGEIFVVPARLPMPLNAQGRGCTISIEIEEKLVALSQAQIGLMASGSLKFICGAEDPLARELILSLRDEARKGRVGNGNYAQALAATLTAHLLQRYGEESPTFTRGNGLTPAQLRRVIEFIQERLEQKVSLSELAAKANLSVYHFARLFKQSTGFSPHEYVNRCRVERAKELLLRTPGANTAEIAKKVGFCDQSHLGRHFRKVAGVSPREFLRSALSLPSKEQ